MVPVSSSLPSRFTMSLLEACLCGGKAGGRLKLGVNVLAAIKCSEREGNA